MFALAIVLKLARVLPGVLLVVLACVLQGQEACQGVVFIGTEIALFTWDAGLIIRGVVCDSSSYGNGVSL